jgi:hypothetical protein
VAGSYEKINYSLRPAKNVERKMMAEVIRKLQPLTDCSTYRYVGFGSTFFADFIHFHRTLGIDRMVSIEHEPNTAKQVRFEFNRPYKNVEIRFGLSTAILAKLEWDTPVFLWLDYDGKLDQTVLDDLNIFCSYAPSGSIVAVSVNTQFDKDDRAIDESALEVTTDEAEMDEALNITTSSKLSEFERRIGRGNVPMGVVDADFTGKRFSKLCWQVINSTIASAISTRNVGPDDADSLTYKQIFNFAYRDGAPMLTVGGIVYKQGSLAQLETCKVSSLPYVRHGEETYKIKVPIMTLREVRYWETQIPTDDWTKTDKKGIPLQDLKRLAEIYRFFPHFSESELA